MSAANGTITAVIFDMDGLIVDSEPFWRRVQAATFDELGADIRPFLGHGHTMGLRVDEAIAYLVAASGLSGLDEPAVAAVVVAGIVEAISTEAVLLPGVLEAIDFLEQHGLALALASGSTPPVIDAVLDRFALRERFRVVSTAADDLLGKPHPAIFLRTAAALGVEATTTLVLEDSLNGVIAAKAARMKVVAIPTPEDSVDPRFSLADLVLTSLLELPRNWPVA